MKFHIVQDIRTSIRTKDAQLLNKTLSKAASEGLTDRQCFRVALAIDPYFTPDEWEDLKKNV